jgi:hypothetical protein
MAAVEYKNFVMYLFEPLMADLLDKTYYDHFMLFVEAVRWLYSRQLNPQELPVARENLKRFVKQTQQLYGKRMMTFNLHQLLHLVDNVENFGPIFVTSNFRFEGTLKWLKKNFNGTTYFHHQFVRTLKCAKYLAQLESCTEVLHPKAIQLLRRLESPLAERSPLKHSVWMTRTVHKAADKLQVTSLAAMPFHSIVSTVEILHFGPLHMAPKSRCKKYKYDSSWICYSALNEQNSRYLARITKIFMIQNFNQTSFVIMANKVNKIIDPSRHSIAFSMQVAETRQNVWIPVESIECVLLYVACSNEHFLSFDVKTH